LEAAIRAIEYLNQVTGSHRQAKGDNLKHAVAALRAGFGERWLKEIVDFKAAEWLGTEFQKNLRPSTIWCASHRQSYLEDAEEWIAKGRPPRPHNRPNGRRDRGLSVPDLLNIANSRPTGGHPR